MYVDVKYFLEASVKWVNEMENIIQDEDFDIRNSELEKNFLALRDEINKKEGQDCLRIYQFMHDVKIDYERYAKTKIKNKIAEDIDGENEFNEAENEVRSKFNNEIEDICSEFAQAVNGKGSLSNGVCSVDLHRQFKVEVEGKTSSSIVPASIVFESLDKDGKALNLAEIAVLEEELPLFVKKVTQEELIVSAIHNHCIYTDPVIMYIHIQSVEPPVSFAEKMARSFFVLNSEPIQG